MIIIRGKFYWLKLLKNVNRCNQDYQYKNDRYTLLILLTSLNIHKNVENFEIYVGRLKATL